jgi:hypothetical protein
MMIPADPSSTYAMKSPLLLALLALPRNAFDTTVPHVTRTQNDRRTRQIHALRKGFASRIPTNRFLLPYF